MTICLERNDRMVVASQAWLVTQDREMAWAEDLIRHNPTYAWILGKYIGTGTPNLNGHIFDATESATTKDSLIYAPMNMLHSPRAIMGTYVGAELVYPTNGPDLSASAALGLPPETEPFVESLAAFWKYYFAEEYELVRMAHAEGSLAQSMEAIPASVTCATGNCGQTFPYAGRTSDTYCEHLNGHAAPKKLNKPIFTAGAIVVPPSRPAWRGARVSEITVTAKTGLRLAAAEGIDVDLYAQVAAEFPHFSEADREAAMGLLVMALEPVESLEDPSSPKPKPPPDAKVNPHAYDPSVPSDPTSPCAVCGRDIDVPIHQGMGVSEESASAADVPGTSVMVALYPPLEVRAALPRARFSDPVDDTHLTLAFLGTDAVNTLDRDVVEAALAPLAAVSTPMEGELSGIGRFAPGYPAGQEPWPLVALADVPALAEFRQRVVAALAGAGIDISQEHGFAPHLTICYVDDDDEEVAAAVLAEGLKPIPVTFDKVVLAWGASRTEFPLAGAQLSAEEWVAAMAVLQALADPTAHA